MSQTSKTQPEKQIIITTGFGTKYEEKHLINLSDVEELLTIKNIIDDIDGGDDEIIDIPIPMDMISAGTMKKIISFCEANPAETETEANPTQTEAETNEKQMERDNEIAEKNKAFMDVPLDELYDLLTGSNFLNYPKLLKVCQKTISKLITNKSTTDIVSIFGVKGTLCVK
tara:strand:+ start:190 stop:702 length:513 start_codon:yes stop_codon:yes gene_type:complete